MSNLSYDELCLPLRNDLLHLARRYSATEAEDLVQDTLIKAFRNWDRFVPEHDPRKDVKAWLKRILTNTFFTQWKRDNRYDVVLFDMNDAEHSGNTQKAKLHVGGDINNAFLTETRVVHNFFDSSFDDNEELRVAVDKLGPMYQEVIVRHYLQEQTYEEIASELGIAITQVQKRLWRARQTLKKSLRKSSFIKSTTAKTSKRKQPKPNRVQTIMRDDDASTLLIGESA